MRYTINYGAGTAYLYTPYPPEERFLDLALTCFGIRKSILCVKIVEVREDLHCSDFERLEFGGDVYVWREDGARKMLAPSWAKDDDWDTRLCEECKYTPKEDDVNDC